MYFIFYYFHILQTIATDRRFEIDNTITKLFSRFNVTGTQLITLLFRTLTTTKEILSVIF
jgi:hypothetical protein